MTRGQRTDMRGIDAVDLKPWTLPLIVAGLVLPVAAAAILLGPAGAFAAGFLMAFTLAVIAVRARYDEEIEVATSPDERHRALIVCLAPIASGADAERVVAAVNSGAKAFKLSAESLVLVPSQNRALSEWLSDVDDARDQARTRMEQATGRLRSAGLEISGHVGEADEVQTVEDTLRTFPARDVIVVSRGGEEKLLGELHRRLDRPVREVLL